MQMKMSREQWRNGIDGKTSPTATLSTKNLSDLEDQIILNYK
jgi:hypothetical protein